MRKKQKVSVITLGCSKNTVDSERLMNQLLLNDCKLTDDPNQAETVIINTCGFIEDAKKESINTILSAVGLKEQGTIKKVIVAGCLSERYKNDLVEEIPEVDAFFGTEQYEGIIKELNGTLKYELLGERKITTPSHTAYFKISEGCDRPCSFCAIPLMRGKHKSYPMERLIVEAEFLAKQGVKELVIIGQDTTDYGNDLYGKRNLAELLNNLSSVKGIEWLRLMYAYPSRFPEDVIDEIADNPKVCKYLDIPLQHISDNVLVSMRRGISGSRTRKLIKQIKERVPEIALRTTLLVGYPNETEKDFEELCDFVREFRFDRLGVFTFSVEENTVSYILGNPVSEKIKQKRKEKIMEIQKEISQEKNSKLVGKEFKVLIDGKEGDFYIARSYRDAPEVDGEILIPAKEKGLSIGTFHTVSVYDYNDYDLFATVLQNKRKNDV